MLLENRNYLKMSLFRLDKLLYVGICENKLDRLKVLHAQTRKMNLSPRVSQIYAWYFSGMIFFVVNIVVTFHPPRFLG